MARKKDKGTNTGEYMALPIESFRAFCRHFPGHGESRTLWAILLLTFENYKLQGLISISQLQQMTGFDRTWIIRCLQNLEAQNMIIVKHEAGKISTIRFQKDPEKWVVDKKTLTSIKRNLKLREKYREKTIKIIEDKLSDDADKG